MGFTLFIHYDMPGWVIAFITLLFAQFSEIVEKIDVYIGKQRMNSDGKCEAFIAH